MQATLPWVDEFRIITLRFTLINKQDVRFGYAEDLGGLLRDRFGAALKHSVCPFPNGPCFTACVNPLPCAYQVLFADSKDEAAGSVSGSSPARPYVVQPPLGEEREYKAGTPLIFQIALFGVGIDYWRFVIAAVRRMAEHGVGLDAAPWRLAFAEQLCGDNAATPHDAAAPPAGGPDNFVYVGDGDQYFALKQVETLTSLMDRASRFDSDQMRIRFVTPTQPRGFDWAAPNKFAPSLAKAVLTRWIGLCRDCCSSPATLRADIKSIERQIEQSVNSHRLQGEWKEWRRVSAGKSQTLANRGYVGAYEMSGDLGILLPLLAIGERTHIGKGSVTGFGRIYCENTGPESTDAEPG